MTGASESRASSPELSVVMPVFNEAEAIRGVLEAWLAELERLGIDFEILVYDDGSSDTTPEILDALAATESRVRVTTQSNRGHGPTISRGYREAVGEWVFQTDSDNELPPEGFEALWRRRGDYDLLLGARHQRRSSLARKAVTFLASAVVRSLFGSGVQDVNSPYRLMRRARLAPLLDLLPDEAFAPNVLISGLAVRQGLRILELPVRHQPRSSGRGSLTSSRLVRGALKTVSDSWATRSRQ